MLKRRLRGRGGTGRRNGLKNSFLRVRRPAAIYLKLTRKQQVSSSCESNWPVYCERQEPTRSGDLQRSPRHCSRATAHAVARRGEGFSERGRGETVDAADFTGVLWSAREETRGVEPPKFGES